MHSDQQAAQQVGITILNTSLCIYYLFHNLISSFVFEYESIHSRHKVTQTYTTGFLFCRVIRAQSRFSCQNLQTFTLQCETFHNQVDN